MERMNVKGGWYVIRDGSEYVEVGYGKGGGDDNWRENVVVYVGVEMLEELGVGEWGVWVEEDKGDVWGRSEYVGGWEGGVGEGWGFWDRLKGKEGMKVGKVSVIKSVGVFLENMKLCKRESRVNL